MVRLQAPSAWLEARPWGCGHLALRLSSLRVGQAMRACLRPMLQLSDAGAGRDPSIQIRGAGSAQPWALGADPSVWLQP
jgi:hypothetical protein